MVYAEDGTIVSTAFQDNAAPLVGGDSMMYRQGSFFFSLFDEGSVTR